MVHAAEAVTPAVVPPAPPAEEDKMKEGADLIRQGVEKIKLAAQNKAAVSEEGVTTERIGEQKTITVEKHNVEKY